LARRGWVHVRTDGSHYIFEHANHPGTLTVPVHGNRDLKPKTQRSIMKQAGLTDADL
jgi:predicted RNA binding protein YcfA (HicA-like mRNA interferase family)